MKKIFTDVLSTIGFAFAIILMPVVAHASDIIIAPTTVQTVAGGSFSVSVLVSGNTQSINAVSGTVNFSTANLTLSSVSKDGSIVLYWADQPTFSNSAGTMNFSGLILNPGFSGDRGTILTMRFVAKTSGTATIGMSSGSVLANDGRATNVTAALGTASVIIAAKEVAPLEPAAPVAGAPVITSSTHADQDAWYMSTDPVFSWDLPSGVSAVRIAYGTNPNTVPTVVYTPAVKQKSLAGIGNGTYYFHAQFRTASGWGPVSHYRFNVDTVSPEAFDIAVDGTTLAFETTDTVSGIDHYEFAIADEAPTKIAPDGADGYTVSGHAAGTYPITVRAIDKAGNVTSAVAQIVIPVDTALPKPVVASLPNTHAMIAFGPMTALYALLGLLIALTLAVIWVALIRFGILKRRIKRELESIEETIRGDFENLREQFDVHSDHVTPTKARSKAGIDRIFKSSIVSIDLVERDIGHKIESVKKKI